MHMFFVVMADTHALLISFVDIHKRSASKRLLSIDCDDSDSYMGPYYYRNVVKVK